MTRVWVGIVGLGLVACGDTSMGSSPNGAASMAGSGSGSGNVGGNGSMTGSSMAGAGATGTPATGREAQARQTTDAFSAKLDEYCAAATACGSDACEDQPPNPAEALAVGSDCVDALSQEDFDAVLAAFDCMNGAVSTATQCFVDCNPDDDCASTLTTEFSPCLATFSQLMPPDSCMPAAP